MLLRRHVLHRPVPARPCPGAICQRPHSITCRGSTAGDAEPSPETPDIDALASFLTKQAAEMRKQLSSSDDDDILEAVTGVDSQAAEPVVPEQQAVVPNPVPILPVIPPDVTLTQQEGGFIPQDFAIFRVLGRLTMKERAKTALDVTQPLPSTSSSMEDGPAATTSTTSTSSSSSSPSDTTTSTSSSSGSSSPSDPAAVYVFAARYNSGLPYEGPLTMTLREYPAGVRPVGLMELVVQKRLLGSLPNNKWQAGAEDPTPTPPVVQLLGYFEAPPSDPAYEATGEEADSLWMVYKFEGLRPMTLMLEALEAPKIRAGPLMWFKGRDAAAAAAVEGRQRLLRAICRGLLSALSYCHSRGVAHCSLGPGSVLLNSVQEADVWRLLVKLDNWGLARVYPAALPGEVPDSPALVAATSSSSSSSLQDTDAAEQQARDLQAACLLVVEVLLVGLAPEGAQLPDTVGLQRLLMEVFHESIGEFREYCSQEPDFEAFVEFMDAGEGAGWQMLEQLLSGRVAAGQLLRLPFFAVED